MNIPSEEKLWAVIPAAGIGSRFGATLPKQYAEIAGAPILEHSLRVIVDNLPVAKVVVALATDDQYFANLAIGNRPNVTTVVGGASRAASVLNALRALANHAADDDWVLVHDAARPLLQPRDLRNLVLALQRHPVGGILAVPVRDTLKRVARQDESSNGMPPLIEATIDRERVWCAQTPQMFRFGLLHSALQAGLQSANTAAMITDEASALEQAGYTVAVIEGDPSNLKITTADDLSYAEFLWRRRHET